MLDFYKFFRTDTITKKIDELQQRFKDKNAIDKIKKVVNGHIVMKLKGLTQKDGPKIGKIINTTVAWILDHNISLEDTDKIYDFIKNVEV